MNISSFSKFFVLQQSESDCGPACLLMVLKYLQGNESLQKIRELGGTTLTGTSLLGLQRAAQALGMEANGYEADLDALKENQLPCILHVHVQHFKHYIVCWGYDPAEDSFMISDPSKGVELMPADELMEIWETRKLILIEGKNESFKSHTEHKQQKWQFFKSLILEDQALLIAVFISSIFFAFLQLSLSVFSQILIDDILPEQNFNKLIFGFGALMILILFKSLLGFIKQLFVYRQGFDFSTRIVNSFYGRLLRLPKAFFDRRKSGEIIARLNDTKYVQQTLAMFFSGLLTSCLITLATFGIIFFYSKWIALLSLVAFPVYFLIAKKYQPKFLAHQKKVLQGHAESESLFIDSIQGISTLKVYNQESNFKGIVGKVYEQFQDKQYVFGKLKVAFGFISESIGSVITVFAFFLGAYLYTQNQLSIGSLVAVIQLLGIFIGAIASLMTGFIQIQEAKVAFDRLYELVSDSLFEQEKKSETTNKQVIDDEIHLLKAEDLSFRFIGCDYLLENVNFTAKKGESIAFLGENGSGKSSILQLILKFYLPQSGQLKINGKPLDMFDGNDWRKNIGLVPQQPKIFNGTVIDNIVLGDKPNPKEVLAFLQEIGFDAYFRKFPSGYNTLLGEDGINISGGQRQLLALARALYRKPQVLLLDELTLGMDDEVKHFTFTLLEKLKKDSMIILCTHQKEVISFVDRTYTLANQTLLENKIKLPIQKSV